MASQAERREKTTRSILQAAKKLFAARGFASTSIDDIADEAGVRKGAVYHHYASKEEIFALIFNELSAELATLIPPAVEGASDILDAIGRGTVKYLTAIAAPPFRQVLLLDGPAVLGWTAWREVDVFYFGSMIRAPLNSALKGKATLREIDAIAHVVAGAITEAALVCATSDNPKRQARDLAAALQAMLKPMLAT